MVITEAGKAADKRLDSHETYVFLFFSRVPIEEYIFTLLGFMQSRYEFGGPWGVVAIMTGFPVLMYYLWICLWFYDGKLVHPNSVSDIKPFLGRMWGHIAKV